MCSMDLDSPVAEVAATMSKCDHTHPSQHTELRQLQHSHSELASTNEETINPYNPTRRFKK